MKPTTVRLEDNVVTRIDGLAEAMGRSRAWIIKQAIDHYLDHEEWFVQEVQAGLREVEQGKIAPPEAVVARFRKWGADAR